MQASADEIIIIVKKGTPEITIEAIANTVGGHVTRTIPELNYYQIQLDTKLNSLEELNAIIATLSNFSVVESAEPNVLLKLNRLQTNDPLLNVQSHLVSVRAREAWYASRGNTNDLIAIVDTGIDLNHPDLQNKIK